MVNQPDLLDLAYGCCVSVTMSFFRGMADGVSVYMVVVNHIHHGSYWQPREGHEHKEWKPPSYWASGSRP